MSALCGFIMNEILKINEFLRYTAYDTNVGLIILVNDVLNLHLRPASIEQMIVTNTVNQTSVQIITKLDDAITADGGKFYTGTVQVTFDKINASKVYPEGFTLEKQLDLSYVLTTLFNNTRVRINQDECQIVTIGEDTILRFKETSLFWKGDIKLNGLPIIVEEPNPPLTLDGFDEELEIE